MVKLEYQYKTRTETGSLVIKVRMHPDDKESRVITVATEIKLDNEFNYLIHLSPGGALGVSAAGYQWDSQISATWRNSGPAASSNAAPIPNASSTPCTYSISCGSSRASAGSRSSRS